MINLLDDDTRYQLYINIQIFIEDRILNKETQNISVDVLSKNTSFFDDVIENPLSEKEEKKVFNEKSNERSSSNNENAPKVFISYSWDGEAHENWVLNLATKLREKGIDAILDQWELDLGKPIPNFMENSVGKSDRVICVITPKYNEKSINLHGGVGYEYSIISAEIMDKIDTQKFIPLLKEGNNENIPKSLKGRMYIDMRDDSSFEYRLEELLRDIYKEPKNKKPPIGRRPKFD